MANGEMEVDEAKANLLDLNKADGDNNNGATFLDS